MKERHCDSIDPPQLALESRIQGDRELTRKLALPHRPLAPPASNAQTSCTTCQHHTDLS